MDFEHPRLPCFRCLRKVAFDGVPYEKMCRLCEIGPRKKCVQCTYDGRCEPTPLVFSTFVRRLSKIHQDGKAFRTWKDDFARAFNQWHDEVTRGHIGRMHNLNTFFGGLQNALDREDFERLVDDGFFQDAASDAMSTAQERFYREFKRQCDSFLKPVDKQNWGLQ